MLITGINDQGQMHTVKIYLIQNNNTIKLIAAFNQQREFDQLQYK